MVDADEHAELTNVNLVVLHVRSVGVLDLGWRNYGGDGIRRCAVAKVDLKNAGVDALRCRRLQPDFVSWGRRENGPSNS